ncbi:MAG: UDP-N-acetylmuramoyl-L-alanyl-D-glutamate--2,6-diaminopimelate ligase [bacterium]
MKFDALIAAIPGARLIGDGAVEITAVTHDSRDVVPGALFVALPGRTADGRRFIPAAIEKGAVAIATDEPVAGLPCVQLEAPRHDLARLAARLHGEPAEKLRLVGLTGTNGKTTVATLLAAIVRAAGKPEGLIGTIGNRVAGKLHPTRFTTPEAPALHALLAEMVTAGVDVAVMEVTSVGLAEHRVDGLPFVAAGFTNLTVDHLDYHGDLRAYGEAKKPLFTERLIDGGVAVIDVDDDFGRLLADELAEARPHVELWPLSLTLPDAAVRYEIVHLDPHGIRGHLVTPAGPVEIHSPLVGGFNVRNLALAAALARAVDLPAEAITAALAHTRVPGRLQRVEHAGAFEVVVDYAHTPDAITRAIEALAPHTPGRLWCLFGCAGDRDRTKREPMGRAAAAAHAVVVTSDNPRSEDPAAIAESVARAAIAAGRPRADRPLAGHTWVEPDRAAAIHAVLAAARPGDTVLIAGKGHETYQEIHGVRHPFDDVAVATAALDALRAGARR